VARLNRTHRRGRPDHMFAVYRPNPALAPTIRLGA
jgi:hypothetical protein